MCLRVICCDVTLEAKSGFYNDVLYSEEAGDQIYCFPPDAALFNASGRGRGEPSTLAFHKCVKGKKRSASSRESQILSYKDLCAFAVCSK